MLLVGLLARDKTCVVCGKVPAEPSLEHLLDRSSLGPNHTANLTVACVSCNTSMAGIKTLREKIEFIITRRAQA